MEQQGNFLVSDNPNRVFLKSDAINIFPCSRRGQYDTSGVPAPFDPEARLNTERTNRLHTALNGFKNSFIISYDNQNQLLKFVLAGYYIEIKYFDLSDILSDIEPKYFGPSDIAGNLGDDTTEIYAHLSLHTGITLNTTDYTTEILYKQLPSGVTESNYLDVPNEGTNFFMGISFTADDEATDSLSDATLIPHNLKLFTKPGDTWQLEQTSLLPSIDHGEAENSVVLGELHVEQNLQVDEDLIAAKDVYFGSRSDGGKPTISEGRAIDGNLTTNSISVPYTGSIQDFPNTEIKHTGITTAYVHAGSIQADGLAIGGAITIADDENNTATTVASTGVSTVGYGEIDQYLNVGEPTTPTTTIGDIVAGHDIVAENRITAPNLYQTVNAVDKKVPYIDVVEQTNGTWQLQISRATTTALPVAEDEN